MQLFFIFIFLCAASQSYASLTEQEFERVSIFFEKKLTPYTIKLIQKPVRIERNWKQDLIPLSKGGAGGARYYVSSKYVGAQVVGGLARSTRIGIKEYTFVLCHELAHSLTNGDLDSKDIFEEFADYFSVTYCMPGLLVKNSQAQLEMKNIALNVTSYIYDLFEEWRPGFYVRPNPNYQSHLSNLGDINSAEFVQCRLERILYWSKNLKHPIFPGCLGDPKGYEKIMKKISLRKLELMDNR